MSIELSIGCGKDGIINFQRDRMGILDLATLYKIAEEE
jgi:hypothetical protein